MENPKKRDRMWAIPMTIPKGEHRPGFVPIRLFMLMLVMMKAFEFHGSYDCIDLFAGRRAVSKAYVAKGLKSCALDIAIDCRDDAWPWLGRGTCLHR